MPDTPLAVGDIIHGFAEGYFGSSAYSCRRIEAVGPDWIVCRDEDGDTSMASGTVALMGLRWHRMPVTDINGNDCCTPTWRDAVALTTWGRS